MRGSTEEQRFKLSPGVLRARHSVANRTHILIDLIVIPPLSVCVGGNSTCRET